MAAVLAPTPARADDLGAIGWGAAFLLVVGVAVVVLVLGVIAAVAGRAGAPRRRWKAPYAVVGLLLTGAALVLDLLVATSLAGRHGADFLALGVAPSVLSALALLACARLLWRSVRRPV